MLPIFRGGATWSLRDIFSRGSMSLIYHDAQDSPNHCEGEKCYQRHEWRYERARIWRYCWRDLFEATVKGESKRLFELIVLFLNLELRFKSCLIQNEDSFQAWRPIIFWRLFQKRRLFQSWRCQQFFLWSRIQGGECYTRILLYPRSQDDKTISKV